jgi:hypothetical protein
MHARALKRPAPGGRFFHAWALALILTGSPLAAQHSVPVRFDPPAQPGVTVTLTGYLAPARTGEPAIPLVLMERLADEPSLVYLHSTPTPDGRDVLEVQFSFADPAGFRAWHSDEGTQSLLNSIRAATVGASLRLYVAFRPAAQPLASPP